ncbi:MAG: hypothetical protein ACK5JH_06805 [Anaerocolumna sp.]
MENAPLISIIHTFARIPLLFLFVYTFVGGFKKWRYHAQTGAIAVTIDLLLSIAYMANRLLGDRFSDSQADFTGWVLVYIIIHGIIATILIVMEVLLIIERIKNARTNPWTRFHRVMSRMVFFTWCFIFVTGEFFFVYTYLL